MDNALLTATTVAKVLRVKPRTVHRMAEDGRLPAASRMPGARGAYLFRRADVDRLLAAQRAEFDAAAAVADTEAIALPATEEAGAAP